MAEENKSCSIAMHLAVAAVAWNEEMMLKLANLAEQSRAEELFWDAIREWIDMWIEWDAKKLAHEYSLKSQSIDMKFKALLFSWVLANTKQWDEALNALVKAIDETWWDFAEWFELIHLAAKMDLSQLEDVAKAIGWDIEDAAKFVEEVKKKINAFIATNYSVVSTGSSVKPSKKIAANQTKIEKLNAKISEEKARLWDIYKDKDKDLKRLQSNPNWDARYWNKKEWKAELKKLWEKYWKDWASKYELTKYLSWLKKAEEDVKYMEKENKKLTDEYNKALEEDLKVIEDWQNPFNYVWADAEWKFNKGFNWDVSQRVLDYWHYVLARTMLTEDWTLPDSLYKVLLNTIKSFSKDGVRDTLDMKLTEDWILDENRTLDELLTRAYTNTEQLATDWNLRALYRQRLIELASDWTLTSADIGYVKTLIETLRFSWAWAGFWWIIKYTNLLENARDLLGREWVKVSGKTLWNDIVKFLWDEDFSKTISKTDTIKLEHWTILTKRQLLELVTWMVDEVNIYKLIATNTYTDSEILDVASKYLLWDDILWRQKIIDLIWEAKKSPTTNDTRWVIIKALTWKDVSAEKKVWFFDFRRHLKADDDVKFRAKFRDKLSDANKVYIPNAGINDITTNNKKELIKRLEAYRWWFILVTDSQRKLNDVLVEAIDTVNKWVTDPEQKVTVIFSKWWLMWKINYENWKLVFKTPYKNVYDAFMRKITNRTLWQTDLWEDLSKLLEEAVRNSDPEALMKFNEELEEDAKQYFKAMLWKDALEDRLPWLLEQRTWISFKNYNSITNKAEFWKKIDDAFSLMAKTVWTYDQDVITVEEVKALVNKMTPKEIAKDLSSKFWFEIPVDRIMDGKWIRQDVKTAYLNYQLSQSPVELLERKWKLLAVINWWTADNISVAQFKSMLSSWDYKAYKEIFFHNLELSDEELNKLAKSINDMIFDWLAAQLADNLVAMWYSLPLINIRSLLYDYLAWNLNVNNEFARWFLRKNNLPDTIATLNWIVYEAMPTELRFWYDDWVTDLSWKVARVPDDSGVVTDYITRVVEVENVFMKDTYSMLNAMAVIRAWKNMPNAWHEREYLVTILNKYYEAVKAATSWGKKLSFAEAQRLKIQAWYALDMFEQDLLYPRYKQFLTPDERSELFWLKYTLWVTTDSSWLKTIEEYNKKILSRFDKNMENIIRSNADLSDMIAKTSKDVSKEVEKRQKELISKWATIKVVWSDVIIVDVKEELYRQIKNMPDNVQWLDALKWLWRAWLNQLTNEQAFFLLQLIQLARNADNKLNMITQTIYKLHPDLADIDFFYNFKVIDWKPRILYNNLLTWTKFLDSLNNTNTFDDTVKEAIFQEIKDIFAKEWALREFKWYTKFKKKPIYKEWTELLKEIIQRAIDTNIDKLSKSVKWWQLKQFKKEALRVYMAAFNPYTILQNIPKSVMESIDNILSIQQKWIRDAMNLLWKDNKILEVMDWISIQTDFWEVKTFRQVLDWEEENLWKLLFDTESEIVKWADEIAQMPIDRSWSENKIVQAEAENKIIAEKMEASYNDWLQAYLNSTEVVTEPERELMRRARGSARELAKQYTLTNMLADTDNALAWINEEIMKDFKSYILWFWWNVTAWWQLLWTSTTTEKVMNRWNKVVKYYSNLYWLTMKELERYEAKDNLERAALNLAKYFKEIERRLGSIDWIKWVTTNQDINRAFAHLWEVVMNIDSITGLFSLMSWVEWNQFLKFFRFSNPWQASRVNELIIWWVGWYSVWWYRNYVDKTDQWLNRDWFNRTFATNFNESDYQKIIQALSWFTIINKKHSRFMNFLNFINSSNYVTRALMSYPWQLLTIWTQNIWYWLRQIWWQKELWIDDLWEIDKIRAWLWILNWAYNEINLWDSVLARKIKQVFSKTSPDDTNPNSFYNRYWVPDVDDLMENEKFYDVDDIDTIYSKIDSYWNKDNVTWAKWLRNTDAYKDNANNIIDGFHARKFKNIAFVRALQTNRYMQFASASQFAAFMASDAPGEMKKKLLDSIISEAWMHFRNILWLWFSWLDRATWWGNIKNLFIALWQTLNFRWAWWQNIARQTASWINTWINLVRKYWLWKEWREALALYIAKQPEFVNFTKQLWNDLQYTRKLSKIQDNWDWIPEYNEMDFMDFLQYTYEVLQFSSQRWQGIQSYWLTRIWAAWVESVVQSWTDPEIYKDTYWIWALMNNISKNLWRNWKVRNLFVKTLWTMASQWWNWDIAMEYLSNEFWKLSFWSLRYLLNEEEWNAWYSSELIRWRAWAIPTVISWEVAPGWDKAYSYDIANTETRLNITNWRDSLTSWDWNAYTYFSNNLSSFINSSQFFWIIKNVGRLLQPMMPDSIQDIAWDVWIYAMWSPFDLATIWDAVATTEAWKSFMEKWYYIPKNATDIQTLVDEVVWQWNHRPGNDAFNTSMFNFDKSGHMKNLEESNPKDASMELLLNNIKYERDSNYRFVLDKDWNKIETMAWKLHMQDMNDRFNDTNYMTTSNFNFINDWVEIHNDDPNYMLYKELIAEWLTSRYVSQQLDAQVDWYNKTYWLKKDKKVTEKELKDRWLYDQFYAGLAWVKTTITWKTTGLLEAIVALNKPASDAATIKMIERQLSEKWDNESIQRLFKIDEKWNINLSSRYEEYLKEQAKLSSYIRNWDLDSFLAETSSITDMYRKDDPHWIATTVLIGSRIHRINQADTITAEQKAKAINTLMVDNYDFIQQHIPEFIDELWKETAAAYISQMNETIYDISLIWDKLTWENEMGNSSSGRKAAINLSSLAKNLLWTLAKSTGNWDGVGNWKTYNYNYVPIKFNASDILKATWWKWYYPTSSSAVFTQYKPHSKFDISKDINRTVKTIKSQQISNKKQLSKLEDKVTKAIEAES